MERAIIKIAGDHNDAGVDTISQSIGTLKINSVGLKSGGVFDWEISNFDGSSGTAVVIGIFCNSIPLPLIVRVILISIS